MYDPCEMNLIYSTRKHKLETPMTDDRDVMQWTLQWIDSVEPFERLLPVNLFNQTFLYFMKWYFDCYRIVFSLKSELTMYITD